MPQEVTANFEVSVPPPAGFAPLYYLREAFRIAIWDAVAIERISKDPRALPYGIAIWSIANCVPFLVSEAILATLGRIQTAGGLLLDLAFVLLEGALLSLAQVGVCFVVAKWFMAGNGHFVNVLRPLLLGSIVFLLIMIPFAGPFLAVIAWVCVFAMVFQVVTYIEALSAYVLSICVGFLFGFMKFALASLTQ